MDRPIVLTARPLSGQPAPSSESSDVRWVPPSELPGYTVDRWMRIRINDFLARSDSPVITERIRLSIRDPAKS